MPQAKSRCLRVQFFEPVDGKTDYYFGSIKAIYTMFDASTIGLTIGSLYGRRLSEESPIVTDKCRITRVEITRVQQQKI